MKSIWQDTVGRTLREVLETTCEQKAEDLIVDNEEGEGLGWIQLGKGETIAEKIAQLLGNDGTRWETKEGKHFDDLCKEANAYLSIREYVTRYLFPDGSALLASAAYWDIEGDKPFSWAGAEMPTDTVYVINPWSGATVGLTPDDVTEDRLDALAQVMDDTIREELHMELAPCSPFEFFRAYVEKVGEEEAGKIWFS
jgi:hypothetical protein